MKRFLKLVHFEFNRFFNVYLVLIGITILAQIIGAVAKSKQYMNQTNEMLYAEGLSKSEYLEQYGTMSFMNIYGNAWFSAPIMLCAATLLIYVFFIWYRDWFGKNTFSYRLFMLPTPRINIYFSKVTAILLYTLGLIAIQIIIIIVDNQILHWMVPDEYITDYSIQTINTFHYLGILLPRTITGFILTYGGGFVAVCVIFTAIIFERSYRFIGVVYGVLYTGLSILVFFIPILLNEFILVGYFYPLELFLLEMLASLIVLAGAIFIGNYLLKYKIRV